MSPIELLHKLSAHDSDLPHKIYYCGDTFFYNSKMNTYYNDDDDTLFSDEYPWEAELNSDVIIVPEKLELSDIGDELEFIIKNDSNYYAAIHEIHKALIILQSNQKKIIEHLNLKDGN